VAESVRDKVMSMEGVDEDRGEEVNVAVASVILQLEDVVVVIGAVFRKYVVGLVVVVLLLPVVEPVVPTVKVVVGVNDLVELVAVGELVEDVVVNTYSRPLSA
jgi:hypothetical protein